MAASEDTTASKQPGSSNLTSYLKSVIPITYLFMCANYLYGMGMGPLGSLQSHTSLEGEILSQIWNPCAQLHIYSLYQVNFNSQSRPVSFAALFGSSTCQLCRPFWVFYQSALPQLIKDLFWDSIKTLRSLFISWIYNYPLQWTYYITWSSGICPYWHAAIHCFKVIT